MSLFLEKKQNKLTLINIFLLIFILLWFSIPIVQNTFGFLSIFGLLLLCLAFSVKNFRALFFYFFPYILFIFINLILFYFSNWSYGGLNFLYFILSFTLFYAPLSIYFYIDFKSELRVFFNYLFYFFVIYGLVNTILVLLIYPEAARLLASGSIESQVYSDLGSGGYNFIYFLVIVFPFVFYDFLNSEYFLKKSISLFTIALIILSVVLSQYTIATLLIFLQFIVILLLILKIKFIPVLFLITLSIFLLLEKNLLIVVFNQIVDQFNEGNLIIEKFTDLINNFFNISNSEGFLGGRFERYLESLFKFWNSPLFGQIFLDDKSVGGHSSILDTLALYGLIGFLLFFLPLFAFYRNNLKVTNIKSHPYFKLAFFTFIILSFINTTFYIYNLGAGLFFIGPLLIND